jgi:hypothetical protein
VQATEADQLIQSLSESPSDEGDEADEGPGDSKCEIDKVVKRLHQFSVSLLVQQPEGSDSPGWTCPFRCYLAARGIIQDGNFIAPDVLTQWLAKLKYFCINCALVQADQTTGSTTGGMIA